MLRTLRMRTSVASEWKEVLRNAMSEQRPHERAVAAKWLQEKVGAKQLSVLINQECPMDVMFEA